MKAPLSFAVGGDHAGFDYKNDLIAFLEAKGISVKDCGTFSADSVDYPDFAHPVADAVEKGEVLLEWDKSKGKPPVPLLKNAYAAERKRAKTMNFSIALK